MTVNTNPYPDAPSSDLVTVSGSSGSLDSVSAALGVGAFTVDTGGSTNFGQNITEDFVNNLINGPATVFNELVHNIDDFLALIGQYLSSLELNVLKMVLKFISGSDDVTTVPDAVTAILAAINPQIPLAITDFQNWLTSIYNDFQAQFNQVVDILSGALVTPMNDAIAAVKDWFGNLTTFWDSVSAWSSTSTAWWARLTSDIMILLDILHVTHSAAAWNAAWADLLSLFGLANSTTTPVDPAPGIAGAIQGTKDAVVQSITGSTQTGVDDSAVSDALGGLTQTVAGLQEVTSALTASAAGPTTILSDTGQDSPGTGLGSGWTATGATTAVNRDATYGFTWASSGTSARQEFGINNTKLATDDQVGIIVLNKLMGYDALFSWDDLGTPSNLIILRADSPTNPQNYVFARIWYGKVQLGCCVAGTVTLWGSPVAFRAQASSSYAFAAGDSSSDYNFSLVSGNRVVTSYTDSAHQSKLGSGYRYAGQAWFSDYVVANGGETQPASTSWRAYDAHASAGTPPGYGHVTRTTVSGVTMTGGFAPYTFFNNTVVLGSGISLPTSGNAGFIVAEAGLYQFSYGIKSANAATGNLQVVPRVAVNGTAGDAGPDFVYGSGGTMSAGYVIGMSSPVLCNPGDLVGPALSTASGTSWVGAAISASADPSGSMTYMKIAKIG